MSALDVLALGATWWIHAGLLLGAAWLGARGLSHPRLRELL